MISHREALDAIGAHAVSVVPGAAYVITGGTSGLGLLTAQWLAGRGATHLVLCSRSGGDATTTEAVAAMTAAGVRVDVAAVDASDVTAMRALLERVRAVSPIRGVIQSAGRLDDGAVMMLDRARLASVFSAKVSGSWNLHHLTARDTLDFFICYASVAGFLGSPGQANHAAANTFIDALAHARRAQGLPAVSIDWGAWDEIGAAVRHGVVARVAGVGLRSISPDDGLRILSGVLDGSAAQVAVIPVDWNAFLGARHVDAMPVYERVIRRTVTTVRAAAPSVAAGAKPAAATGTSLVQELTDAVPARRSGILRGYLRTRVAKTLGLGEGRVVDDKQPLRDAGLDSLLAIELRNVLGTAIGRTLPATLLFDYPTIDDLAVHLLATLFPSAPAAAPAAPEPVVETPVNLVDDLSSMSDDDVDRLFAEKMRGKS